MANFKSIADVPVAESAEGLNLIVNDGGSAKQIPASQVGAQADWSVTDETSPAFIMNKPEIGAGGYIMEVTVDECQYDGDSTLMINRDYTELMNAISSGAAIWIKVPGSIFIDSGAPDFVHFNLGSVAVINTGETEMFGAMCLNMMNSGVLTIIMTEQAL